MNLNAWTNAEKKSLRALSTPAKIQDFLETLKYNIDGEVRSPREVLKRRQAHCFDGALLAACALNFHGQSCSLVALYATENDDDHVITVFRRGNCFGAIAKSNYVPLRWRDPVYRTLRELVMSYFEGYFTLDGAKNLRAYSKPFDVTKVKDVDWRFSKEDLDPLGERIDDCGRVELLKPWMNKAWLKEEIKLADKRSIKGASVGLDLRGIYKGS